MRWANAGFEIEWLGAGDDAPRDAPLLPGCCLAVRRTDFMRSGGFDAGLIRWGMEDSEFSLRLWLLGQRVVIHPAVSVGHLFRSRHPYEIDHVDIVHNMLRVALIHFSAPRLTRVVEALKRFGGFAAALTRAADSDAMQRRAAFAAQRQRSDDWFFERFDDIF
jgi:GT2 family glycosyltransferase